MCEELINKLHSAQKYSENKFSAVYYSIDATLPVSVRLCHNEKCYVISDRRESTIHINSYSFQGSSCKLERHTRYTRVRNDAQAQMFTELRPLLRVHREQTLPASFAFGLRCMRYDFVGRINMLDAERLHFVSLIFIAQNKHQQKRNS